MFIVQFLIYIFAVAYVTRFFLLNHTSYYLHDLIQIYNPHDSTTRALGLNDLIVSLIFPVYKKERYIWELKENFWTELFGCAYCLSFWVNIIFVTYCFYFNIIPPALLLLCLLSTPMMVGKLLES